MRMPHKQGGNNKVCQAHPPLHTVYAAVGCGTRTAGRFGLSSCHNSPLVRHFTRVSLLCEKILGYEPIIHGMDRNASTPLQKQAARALPYPCRGAFYMRPGSLRLRKPPRADMESAPTPCFIYPYSPKSSAAFCIIWRIGRLYGQRGSQAPHRMQAPALVCSVA